MESNLKQLAPFEDYAFERFDEAVQEAIQWGLAVVRWMVRCKGC